MSGDVYKRFETSGSESLEVIKGSSFGGASVTIPLKQTLLEEMKKTGLPMIVDSEVDQIGAMNTIVKIDGVYRIYNTDWRAIHSLLSS